jgi:hypothetical protein
LKALIALGRGCGISAAEVAAVRVGDVRRLNSGDVVVSVRHPHRHDALCLPAWANRLCEAAQVREPRERATYLVAPWQTPRSGAVVTALVGRVHCGPGLVPFDQARLVAGWRAEIERPVG